MNEITLLNPGAWPALLLATIPLLIHRLTQNARRTRYLPTLHLLRNTLQQQPRILRFRHWILLLLRTLLLLCLTLAFLKPAQRAPLATTGNNPRTVLLLLDLSLSMQARTAGTPAITRARNTAFQLLNQLQPADRVNLLLATPTPELLLPQPSTERAPILHALRNLQPSSGRANLDAALPIATQHLDNAPTPQRELWILSDFQRTAWTPERLRKLPARARILFLHAAPQHAPNTAITYLQVQPDPPLPGQTAQITLEIWNGTPTPRALQTTLRIQPEDPALQTTTRTRTLNVPPNTTVTTAFPVQFPRPARYRITASLPGDQLPADNQRYLALDLVNPLNVLLITTEPATRHGIRFLTRALNPAPHKPGGIRITPRNPIELTTTDLQNAHAIILYRTHTFPADRLQLLYQHLARGGNLLLFLTGPEMLPHIRALHNRATRDRHALPFLPTTYIHTPRAHNTIAEARLHSPFLRLFKDLPATELTRVRFTRFFLTTTTRTEAEILLRFQDGTPAAAHTFIGQGNLLLCNFSPEPEASDLARHPCFPPLLHEFLKTLAPRKNERRALLPGEPAAIPLPAATARNNLRVLAPGGQNLNHTLEPATKTLLLENTAQTGFYTVRTPGQNLATFTVNTPPEESDLRTINPEPRQPHTTLHATQPGIARHIRHLHHHTPLWPHCLLAASALLLIELLLANTTPKHPSKP